MRFRPEQHLRLQGDIKAAREGSRLDCRSYTLWWRRDQARAEVTDASESPSTTLGACGRPYPRVGVVASTAAVGNAVRRNRAKRRLREIFRRNQQLLPAGCDVLLVARSGVIHRPFAELENKFVEACGILSRPSVSNNP